MSKVLHCGDVMEGCAQVLRGTTEDEVMQQAGVHAARDRTCRWSGGISPMRSTGCWNVLDSAFDAQKRLVASAAHELRME